MKIIEIAACLLTLALLPACSTTSQTTAGRETLEQKMMAKYASNGGVAGQEPAPPAEGPEEIPATGPSDPDDNPALVPTPLLRYWASSRTP